MRLMPTLVLALLAAVLPAQAQEEPPKTCKALAKDMGIVVASEDSTFTDIANGCRITDVYVMSGTYSRYRIGEAILVAPDLFEAIANDTVFSEAELTLRDMRLSPDIGSPLQTYISEVQSAPLEVHLAYRWDRATGASELADFSLRGGDFGGISLSGRFSNFALDDTSDLTDLPDIANVPGAIDELTLTLENGQFFTAMVAPMLLNLLPYDQDPRPEIERTQRDLVTMINALPGDTIGGDSKAVLVNFVESFPRPTGTVTVELRADPPLQFSEILTDNLVDFNALMGKLTIAASHQEPAAQ